jgi:hypothetical protein
MTKKISIIDIVILIAILLVAINLSEETTLQIKKFDISKSNSPIMNITTEELGKYPVLEKSIDCTDKNFGYDSVCKVSKDDWIKIRDFIESKYKNSSYDDGDVSPCIKFGDKYGETCYQFIFIRRV